MKKIYLLLLAMALIAAPAFAGNAPELDAVGNDSANVFLQDSISQFVILNLFDFPGGVLLNTHSDFTNAAVWGSFKEFFKAPSALRPDICVGNYLSSLTPAALAGVYQWRIVLQMTPETDLDIVIHDCVTKHNTFNILGEADQTGRYRADSGELIFLRTANPFITVQAYPGPYPSDPAFVSPFWMDGRTLPNLDDVALRNVRFTTKALWSESIIAQLPATGHNNLSNQATYDLKAGDLIDVVIAIPKANTVDVAYGKDNVIVKYVGIIGTFYDEINH